MSAYNKKELSPLLVEEVVSLRTLGIESPLGLKTCALSSETTLCVQKGGHVVLVDIAQKTAREHKVTADAAIIHPQGKILALRAGRTVQLFDLEVPCRLKTTELEDDTVQLWKWVGEDILAIVNKKVVLHWTISGDGYPAVVMPLDERTATGVAINYRADETFKWLLLATASVVGSRVVGCCQLFSVERSCSQILDADAAAFTSVTLPRNSTSYELLAFVTCTEIGGKLSIALLNKPKQGEAPYFRKTEDLELHRGSSNDFPVAVEAESRLGVVFVVWKRGMIAVHDVETGRSVCSVQAATSGLFATVPRSTGGLLVLSKLGHLLSVSFRDECIVPYLEAKKDVELAVRLPLRAGLPVPAHLLLQWFERLVEGGRYCEAAWLAAVAPQHVLRTPQILERLRQMPGENPAPVMVFFGELLDRGRLTDWEAVQLCGPVLQKGRNDLVEKWLRDNRLECSETLGELLLPFNHTLALSVFLRAGVVSRVINCFAEAGQFQKLFAYAEKMSHTPCIPTLVAHLLNSHKENAVLLAVAALREGKYEVDVDKVVDVYLEKGMFDESTTLLEAAVQTNSQESSPLQTRLLCLYLQREPHRAESLLAAKKFSHFDRWLVAGQCEQSGLLHRALELFTDLADWQRILARAWCIDVDHLVAFFSSMDPGLIVPCLSSMLVANRCKNLEVAVHVAVSCHTRIPITDLINLFESLEENEGLFLILNQTVDITEDEEVHFKYIVVASKLEKFKDLEMFCRTSNAINPIRVQNFLMEAKLRSFAPLMILCDRFDLINGLVTYLVKADLIQHLAHFLTQVNPSRLGEVLDCLLSLNVDDGPVLAIVSLAKGSFVPEVVRVADKYGRLSVLWPWLQGLEGSGSCNPAVHTALAKLAVVSSSSPERFLEDNSYYDFYDVGKFCEPRNPELAVTAFARGELDEDALRVCEENGLIKTAARYLLRRCKAELWQKALVPDNPERASLAENIAHLVTTESFTSEQISLAVKALFAANLPNQLLRILETLVYDCPEFASHRNLQNLLILCAIKTDPARVKDLIKSLQEYDAPDVAVIAQKNGLYEEAFAIYERCGVDGSAMDVLLKDLEDWDRALEFAQRRNTRELWTQLGQARLRAGHVPLAVDALIHAGDASAYQGVVSAATSSGLWPDLCRYLEVARRNAKEPAIDAELLFVYANSDKLADLERMTLEPHMANVKEVAERCFVEGLFEAAKILFKSISCYGRLGETLALLGDLPGAVDAARRARSIQCWRTLCDISLMKGDMEVARVAAKHLAQSSDETSWLVLKFESLGLEAEITALLESLLTADRAASSVFTELALLYIRHEPEKCRCYLDTWWSKMHVPRVLRALNEAHLWDELVILLERHGDWCEAVAVMMAHPTHAWNHTRFRDLLAKVMNCQMVQPVILFYLEYKPLLLNDVLTSLGGRLDAGRVVTTLSSAGHLPLGRPYLESRLDEDLRAVNEAMCELLLEEGNWLGLRSLVTSKMNINAVTLASRLEHHESLGFRTVSVDLYRRCGRWTDALRVCQRDHLRREAIEVVGESGDSELVEKILAGFLEEKRGESFSAALLHCFHLIRPDVVLELAWRYDAWCFAMPYFVQSVHDLQVRLLAVEEKLARKTEETVTTNLSLTWSPTDS